MPPRPAERDRFVTGLVLGAGGSKRLGRPKQLLAYGTGTLLGHVVDVARECRFDETIVAIGGSADEVRERVDLAGTEVVVNEAYGAGCSSSIAAALAVVDRRCDVLVLMLGDQPGVGSGTVAALLAGRGDAELAVCRYDDGRGHPIAFGRGTFAALADLHGDKGVWRLLDERRRRRRRGADRRPDPARRRHRGGLPGRPRRARADMSGAGTQQEAGEAAGRDRSDRPRRRDPGAAPRGGRLPRRRGAGDLDLPQPAAAAAAAARGRGRGRQDRGGAGARGRARHAADPPAVLRGDRRGGGALRMELPAAAAQHPARRIGRARARGGGAVRQPTT